MAGKHVKLYDTEVQESREEALLLYIVPQRIQKRRYLDLRSAAIKRKIKLADKYSPNVTHLVTEFETEEQVLRCLKLDKADLEKKPKFLSMAWFTDSMRAGQPVEVQEKHRLKSENGDQQGAYQGESGDVSADVKSDFIADWACQRVTCLQHPNSRFTTALEVIQHHAELRDTDQDYSRALAFRRASCVLKSLPFTVTTMAQIKDLKDLGGHSKKVIKDILEEGTSDEVEKIKDDEWFRLMKQFTAVFGVGPSTAKKWIERGWSSVEEARRNSYSFSDWRVVWGLAFHTDLTTAVTRAEADFILGRVRREVESILPGAIVELTGGFRRGKPMGHDVDLLITHPTEGEEQGILGNLLKRMENQNMVLCGNLERSTYSDVALEKDFKLSARGQLDHFEKWLGMIKVDQNCVRLESQAEGGTGKASSTISLIPAEDIKSDAIKSDAIKSDAMKSDAIKSDAIKSDAIKRPSVSGSLDIDIYASNPKRKKVTSDGLKPHELADSERVWLARRVDLIISPYSQFYYALVGWTGSKHYNRDLRLYASKKLDMKLTSHGLYDQTKNASLPASSEKEVFGHLKLEYREPWERNC